MDEGGEWKDETWAGHRSGRRIKPLFQGVGAHTWIVERRSGLSRRMYNRLASGDRFPSKQIPSEVQRCPGTLIPASGYSANQIVFGSNPVDLSGGDDKNEDLLFAQDA